MGEFSCEVLVKHRNVIVKFTCLDVFLLWWFQLQLCGGLKVETVSSLLVFRGKRCTNI